LEVSVNERTTLLEILESKFEKVSRTKAELAKKVEELEKQSKRKVTIDTEPLETTESGTLISRESDSCVISESDIESQERMLELMRRQIQSLEARLIILKSDDEIHKRQVKEREDEYININAKDILTGSTKSGFLTKQGNREKKWKKRFFVLRQNYLFYYKTKNEKKGKFIRLNDCVIESSVDSKKKIIFIIINHDKQYPMYGETDDISAEWIKDLQNTISAIPDLEKNKGKATLSEKRRNSKRYTTLQKLRISFAPKQQKEPDTEEKKRFCAF